MKTIQKQMTDSKIEITFTFDKSDIDPQMAKATENLASNIKMDGFRAGKVPANIVKQTVGDVSVFDEALRLTIQKVYPEYIEQNKIGVISQPEVLITKLVPEGESECKITVEIIPVLNVKDYKEKAKEIMKTKKEIKVEDKEVEDTIKWVLESRSNFIELEREAQEHDIIDVNYDIIVDDKPQEELKAIDYKFIISKEQTFPELNNGVLGMKKGEVKDIEITFKKDFYIEALKDKKGIIRVTLNKILQRQIPELNDEFVKKLGKFENVESFKKNISDGILQEKQIQEDERIKLAILDSIQQDVKIEVPTVLVEKEIERMLEEVKYRVTDMGMCFEDYLKQIKKTEEEVRNDIREDARKKVINVLILREIIDLEKITVSEEEIHNKTQQIMNDLSYQNPNIKDVDINTINNYSEEILKNEKVFKFLMSA